MSEKPEANTPRFFAWLYCTPSQQPVLAGLCALEREIGASLRPGVDHHVAHTRLEWWREECARCAAGNPVHPLTRELRTHLERLVSGETNAALAGLPGLVEAAHWDLARATFERREELTAYCRLWATAMITPMSTSGNDAPVDSSHLGALLREIELLGDLAREARAGRLRLPLEELERGRVAPEAIATPPWPEPLAAMLRQRHRALRRELSALLASLAPTSQQRLRGLLVWSALSWHRSRRAQRALPQPPDASIASAAAMNWRAWRAAGAAAAGRLHLQERP
ncbi:MAG: squalene/phytoene synthase family protein [Steroidobacteraceae bacterium]